MTTNYPARHEELQGLMRRLGRELSCPVGGFANLHKAAMTGGALDAKTKELIAIGIAVGIHCDPCVAYHVHDALKAGATRAEVLEAVGVAIMMGGGPAAMYACNALAALDQFEGAQKK